MKKRRREEEKFIIEGIRLVQEALTAKVEILDLYVAADIGGGPEAASVVARARRRGATVHEVGRRELAKLSDTVSSQGVLAVARQHHVPVETLVRDDASQSVVVAFDGVADPGNLGSMIRTADWFGVTGVVTGRGCVDLYNPKVVRSTMGSMFHIPIAVDVDLLPLLSRARSLGYAVYVTDAAGETHFDRLTFSRRAIIVFGNEAWGVSDQVKALADVRVAIRRYGAAESLNVGVACGIVLSGLHRLYDE